MAHKLLSSQDWKNESSLVVDLTPLTDVIFILLIFFIVTASFLVETGVDAFNPPKITSPPKDKTSITIRLDNTDQITLNGQSVDKRMLAARITEIRAGSPDAELAVMVAPDSTADSLVHIIDAARSVGFGKVPVTAWKQ